MARLSIRFVRKPDGAVVLSCTRPDGSQTWQRHDRHAAFFVLHDLTHFAVETTLGLRYGFYGLLADGWNIPDFGTRAIPSHAAFDAALAEAAAGILDGERATGYPYDTEGFNQAVAAALEQMGHAPVRPVTGDELEAVRALWMELAGRWAQVPAGGEMELVFECMPADEE